MCPLTQFVATRKAKSIFFGRSYFFGLPFHQDCCSGGFPESFVLGVVAFGGSRAGPLKSAAGGIFAMLGKSSRFR